MSPDEQTGAERVLTKTGDLRQGQADVVLIEGIGIEEAPHRLSHPST